MPTHRGIDSKGTFYQYGNQKKYYFTTPRGSQIAKAKADKQGRAINYSRHLQ
jgi:hypothetical protein